MSLCVYLILILKHLGQEHNKAEVMCADISSSYFLISEVLWIYCVSVCEVMYVYCSSFVWTSLQTNSCPCVDRHMRMSVRWRTVCLKIKLQLEGLVVVVMVGDLSGVMWTLCFIFRAATNQRERWKREWVSFWVMIHCWWFSLLSQLWLLLICITGFTRNEKYRNDSVFKKRMTFAHVTEKIQFAQA